MEQEVSEDQNVDRHNPGEEMHLVDQTQEACGSSSPGSDTSGVKSKRLLKAGDSGISVEKSEYGSDDEDSHKRAKLAVAETPKERASCETLSSCINCPTEHNGMAGEDDKKLMNHASDEDMIELVNSKALPGPNLDKEEADEAIEEEEGLKEEMDDESNSDTKKKENEEKIPEVLKKLKPKHMWCVLNEVIKRESGQSARLQSSDLFRLRMYSSLHVVERLELMYKLQHHRGCVNALNFNPNGTLLASGSDDLRVVVWDWARGKSAFSYDSGHSSNVFQAKFLPLTGDTHLVTCARDGQVRLAELCSSSCKYTKRLASHKAPAHRVAVQNDSPHEFLSAGEDAVVFHIDLRESKANKILQVREGERKVPLYSIHSNPLRSRDFFCVGGRDQYVRVYDQRTLSVSNPEPTPLIKFCPTHLVGSDSKANVTCCVFSNDGKEVLASYNDEDIYLFDMADPDGTKYLHRYQGHRNSETVKGVNFFGPRSEFIVSGSDCGNIFFWEKQSEAVVQFMPGDENGVVNCLEPHPKIPILATSGLDDDVKIWIPTCEYPPKFEHFERTVQNNLKEREDSHARQGDTVDSHMLWVLWRHLSRAGRARRRRSARLTSGNNPTAGAGEGEGNEDGHESGDDDDDDYVVSSSSDDSDSDAEGMPRAVQCAPS